MQKNLELNSTNPVKNSNNSLNAKITTALKK